MRELLASLRSSIQEDMKGMVADIKKEMAELGGRTDRLEQKMAELIRSHNDLLDAHEDLKGSMVKMQAKTLDLEDRSRRNNIRIRGIDEAVLSPDLRSFLQDFIKAVLPSAEPADIVIDRIHRIPKPSGINPSLPRDVIARIHFYELKENFLRAIRKQPSVPDKFEHLLVFQDLSPGTMAMRRAFLPHTQDLRNNNVPYRWGFPTKLFIRRDGSTSVCFTPSQAGKLLSQWGLATSDTSSPVSSHRSSQKSTPKNHIDPEWAVA